MGNKHPAGVKKDDHGGSCNQQPQVVSVVLDQPQAGVKGDDHGGSRNQQPQVVPVVLDQLQAGGAAENQLQPFGGDGGGHHHFEATSMLKDCKTNSSATYGGGSRTRDLRLAAEYLDDDPHHPSPPSLPEPEGVLFVLNTFQAGVKGDDHGGSCNQQPQVVPVVLDQLQAGVKGDDHGGSRNQQPQAVSVVLDQLQDGVKGDDHGGSRNQQPQVASVVLDQFQAGGAAENQLQPLGGDGGGHDFEATSMLKNCKTNSTATYGGGSRTSDLRLAAEYLDDDPHHPSPPSLPKPEGVLFVLNTLPVNARCVGDGDGFTAYVKNAADVPQLGSQHVTKMAGDTNNRDTQKYRIRMRGIDAPELQMKYGVESKNELVKLIGGKCVAIHVYGKDQYGRYLGDIFRDGVFIQEQMLKRGFAWHFKICDKRPELAQWEREAKAARRGLWSLDNPQKPWEWRRDQRNKNKKENADDIQVELQSQGNGSSETLPWLIKKDMETLGREWKNKLEIFVTDKMKLNDQLQELKRNKKEAEDRAKELEKEMKNVVADNMKLNDQLQELKRNKKEAEDRALKLIFFSESVAAVNMDLHDRLEELKKKNEKAEDRAKESEKEMKSVVADNMKLNDQLQELKRNKKVAEDRAVELEYFSENVAVVNMELHDKLEELKKMNKKAEDRAKESEKDMESVVADNMKLNDQIRKLNMINKKVANFARNSKKKLQSILAVNMDLNVKLQELQKKNKKAEDRARQSKKELENVVVENMERKLQGIWHKKSEQAVETPSAPPAKDSSEKETIVWRKKMVATTPSAPPAKGRCE